MGKENKVSEEIKKEEKKEKTLFDKFTERRGTPNNWSLNDCIEWFITKDQELKVGEFPIRYGWEDLSMNQIQELSSLYKAGKDNNIDTSEMLSIMRIWVTPANIIKKVTELCITGLDRNGDNGKIRIPFKYLSKALTIKTDDKYDVDTMIDASIAMYMRGVNASGLDCINMTTNYKDFITTAKCLLYKAPVDELKSALTLLDTTKRRYLLNKLLFTAKRRYSLNYNFE